MLINFYSFISLLNVSSFFFYFFNNNLISPLYQNSKKAIVFEYNKIEETFDNNFFNLNTVTFFPRLV